MMLPLDKRGLSDMEQIYLLLPPALHITKMGHIQLYMVTDIVAGIVVRRILIILLTNITP